MCMKSTIALCHCKHKFLSHCQVAQTLTHWCCLIQDARTENQSDESYSSKTQGRTYKSGEGGMEIRLGAFETGICACLYQNVLTMKCLTLSKRSLSSFRYLSVVFARRVLDSIVSPPPHQWYISCNASNPLIRSDPCHDDISATSTAHVKTETIDQRRLPLRLT